MMKRQWCSVREQRGGDMIAKLKLYLKYNTGIIRQSSHHTRVQHQPLLNTGLVGISKQKLQLLKLRLQLLIQLITTAINITITTTIAITITTSIGCLARCLQISSQGFQSVYFEDLYHGTQHVIIHTQAVEIISKGIKWNLE